MLKLNKYSFKVIVERGRFYSAPLSHNGREARVSENRRDEQFKEFVASGVTVPQTRPIEGQPGKYETTPRLLTPEDRNRIGLTEGRAFQLAQKLSRSRIRNRRA